MRLNALLRSLNDRHTLENRRNISTALLFYLILVSRRKERREREERRKNSRDNPSNRERRSRDRERGGKRKEKEKNIRERYPTAMQIFRRSIANPGASVRNGRSLYQKWTCRFASPGHARKYDMRDLENGAFGS